MNLNTLKSSNYNDKTTTSKSSKVLFTQISQITEDIWRPQLEWAIALNFCTPGVEEQWNSSGVSYKSCGILKDLSQKSWNSLGVKH